MRFIDVSYCYLCYHEVTELIKALEKMQEKYKLKAETLKKSLLEAKKWQREEACLTHTRIQLEAKKIELEKTIEKDLIAQSRFKHKSYSNTLSKKIETNKELLENLYEEIKQLDHLLDNFEHLSVESIESELIEILSQIDPNTPQKYALFKEKKKSLQLILKDFEAVLEKTRAFLRHLHTGLKATTKKSIFSIFVFQKHPKIIIAESLAKGLLEAKAILDLVENTKHSTALYKTIKNYLVNFISEAEKPWNKKLYDKELHILYHKFDSLMSLLEKEYSLEQEKNTLFEKEFDEWMEQSSRV